VRQFVSLLLDLSLTIIVFGAVIGLGAVVLLVVTVPRPRARRRTARA
jgi:hypothetical protein